MMLPASDSCQVVTSPVSLSKLIVQVLRIPCAHIRTVDEREPHFVDGFAVIVLLAVMLLVFLVLLSGQVTPVA